MSTPIDITFYLPLRIMLGDLDPTVQKYPDLTLQAGVRTALQLGKVPGYGLRLTRKFHAPRPPAHNAAHDT